MLWREKREKNFLYISIYIISSLLVCLPNAEKGIPNDHLFIYLFIFSDFILQLHPYTHRASRKKHSNFLIENSVLSCTLWGCIIQLYTKYNEAAFILRGKKITIKNISMCQVNKKENQATSIRLHFQHASLGSLNFICIQKKNH